MHVILCYDIRQKRISKINKTCKKYLTPVQRSVFEGEITEGKLSQLQSEIKSLIEPTEDSVVIYATLFPGQLSKHQIGLLQSDADNFL